MNPHTYSSLYYERGKTIYPLYPRKLLCCLPPLTAMKPKKKLKELRTDDDLHNSR